MLVPPRGSEDQKLTADWTIKVAPRAPSPCLIIQPKAKTTSPLAGLALAVIMDVQKRGITDMQAGPPLDIGIEDALSVIVDIEEGCRTTFRPPEPAARPGRCASEPASISAPPACFHDSECRGKPHCRLSKALDLRPDRRLSNRDSGYRGTRPNRLAVQGRSFALTRHWR